MNSKEQEIRKYLDQEVDCYLKPLLLDLMKQQPGNVYEFMSEWINNRGEEIKVAKKAEEKAEEEQAEEKAD